jgi:hypothetical protein
LSDSSYPSEHVRQNATVASYLYPSSDNGAWIVSEDKVLIGSANDPAALDTVFRSRMLSLFGFGTIQGLLKERVSLFPEPVLAAARRNLELYKRYRHLLHNDCYHQLPAGSAEKQWQATQFISPAAKEAVILVFKGESSQETVQVRLRGVQTSATYEIAFANGGPPLQAGGDELLSKGITVSLAHPATSEVVFLRMLA